MKESISQSTQYSIQISNSPAVHLRFPIMSFEIFDLFSQLKSNCESTWNLMVVMVSANRFVFFFFFFFVLVGSGFRYYSFRSKKEDQKEEMFLSKLAQCLSRPSQPDSRCTCNVTQSSIEPRPMHTQHRTQDGLQKRLVILPDSLTDGRTDGRTGY